MFRRLGEQSSTNSGLYIVSAIDHRIHHRIHHLVGGWATPLKNMSSSIGIIQMATGHHQPATDIYKILQLSSHPFPFPPFPPFHPATFCTERRLPHPRGEQNFHHGKIIEKP